MARVVLFYISGHGYGHSRRAAEVIRALREASPDLQVHVRTSAPAHLFAGVSISHISTPHAQFDPGMVERDVLSMDVEATLARAAATLRVREEIVAHEAAYAQTVKPDLILADIPFMAGDVAEAAGLPCIGISNFTWDWIYEPLATGRHADLVKRMADSYAKMRLLLRLPLGGGGATVPRVIDVGLVASPGRRPPKETALRLPSAALDGRPRILVGLRGGVSDQTLIAAAREAPDLVFLAPQAIAPGGPANLHALDLREALTFADAMRLSDVVVSKLGYGTVADCIAGRKAILWPRRTGFREDLVSATDGPRFLRMREIAVDDFHAGRWAADLRALLDSPPPPESIPADGASRAAALCLAEL